LEPTPTRDDPRLEELEQLRSRVAELASKEALLGAILASTLDPTITIDEYGEIVAASESVERVFGYTSDELIGQNIRLLMPEPHHSAHDSYLANYRRTGETHILGLTREFRVIRKGGEWIDCDLSVSRVDLENRTPLFIGSFRDVTERNRGRRALEESERRLHAMFDESFQYIGLLTPDGTLLEANEASLEGTGVTREEVIGRPFWETRWWQASEASRDQLRDGIRRAAAGEFVRFEAQHLGRDGETLTVDFSLTPVKDETGQVVQLVPEGRDITELKRAQRAETAMLRSLATIGESAAVLAHEIKNPITSVNLALRAVADQLGEDHQVVLQDLVARMQRLERVMRRTLSFTKPVNLNRVDLDGAVLVTETVNELRPEIEPSEIDVRIEPCADDVHLSADRQLLGEVLTNLLSNALEALIEGGGHEIVLAVRRDEHEVVFTVEDDGPGVPGSLRETLFKPFYTSKTKGSGLGLAFCLKVVEEHGGSLHVEDTDDGGARFVVRMPSRAPETSC
jgi:PAS domain S-box-containing protein